MEASYGRAANRVRRGGKKSSAGRRICWPRCRLYRRIRSGRIARSLRRLWTARWTRTKSAFRRRSGKRSWRRSASATKTRCWTRTAIRSRSPNFATPRMPYLPRVKTL